MIKLAQASDTPHLDHILPAAFYTLTQEEGGLFRQIFGTFEDEQRLVSYEVEKASLLGWQSLMGEQFLWTFSWPFDAKVTYPHPLRCNSILDCPAVKQALAITIFLPPTKPMSLNLWNDTWEKGLCSNCKSRARYPMKTVVKIYGTSFRVILGCQVGMHY